jgi:hypothetical protein
MKIGPLTTLREMAFIVSTALEESKISAVLSGGGAATVYAPESNQSNDLDFVLSFWSSLGVSNQCLIDLGFVGGGTTYVHEASKFTLEFPAGPLMIGNEVLTTWTTLVENGLTLNILSPDDCVRDRLSWFLFYNNVDYSALEQALAVAIRSDIDIEKIKSWAVDQGAGKRFSIFESRHLADRKRF